MNRVRNYTTSDSSGTQQSENTSLNQSTIAATMNAEMMANGGANMSFEERLSYLTNRMSEIGNQSAFSQDTQALNNQLGAGIDSVNTEISNDIGQKDFLNNYAKVNKKAQGYKNQVLTKEIKNTNLKAFNVPYGLNEKGEFVNKETNKVIATAEQVKRIQEKYGDNAFTKLTNYLGEFNVNGKNYQTVSKYNQIKPNENLGNKTQIEHDREAIQKDIEDKKVEEEKYSNLAKATFMDKLASKLIENIDLGKGETFEDSMNRLWDSGVNKLGNLFK